jgi:hypothetical protein
MCGYLELDSVGCTVSPLRDYLTVILVIMFCLSGVAGWQDVV